MLWGSRFNHISFKPHFVIFYPKSSSFVFYPKSSSSLNYREDKFSSSLSRAFFFDSTPLKCPSPPRHVDFLDRKKGKEKQSAQGGNFDERERERTTSNPFGPSLPCWFFTLKFSLEISLVLISIIFLLKKEWEVASSLGREKRDEKNMRKCLVCKGRRLWVKND